MSINLVSDDSSSSSCDLPDIYIPGTSTPAASRRRRGSSTSTVKLNHEEKENEENFVDLTQGDMSFNAFLNNTHDEEPLTLSGSSTRSIREVYDANCLLSTNIAKHATGSKKRQDTSSEPEGDNNDAIFDELFAHTNSRTVPLAATKCTSSGTSYVPTSPSTSGGSSLPSTLTISSGATSLVGGDSPVLKKKRKYTVKNGLEGDVGAKKITKQQQAAEERAARRQASEAVRAYRPGECMKHMYVEMHPTLADAWYVSDVTRELSAVGSQLVRAPDLFDSSLVLWSRRSQQKLLANNGQVELGQQSEVCGQALLVLEASAVAELVAARSLARRVASVAGVAGPVTLAVFGLKDYFKKNNRRNANNKEQGADMTEIELEMAFTDLLVSVGCDAVIVYTPNELALLILHFTKAIAEEPYKRAKRAFDEQAEFYMRGENKKCMAVDKDGHGLGRLWQQMVAVLPLSSLETARAVCALYRSPSQLYQELQTSEGVARLAGVEVSRAAVPGARARRLGPELARKLHMLLTADDGDALL